MMMIRGVFLNNAGTINMFLIFFQVSFDEMIEEDKENCAESVPSSPPAKRPNLNETFTTNAVQDSVEFRNLMKLLEKKSMAEQDFVKAKNALSETETKLLYKSNRVQLADSLGSLDPLSNEKVSQCTPFVVLLLSSECRCEGTIFVMLTASR